MAGARPATGDVELEDYERLFARRAIHTGTRESLPAELPLYRRLLGDAYAALPAPLQAMHDLRASHERRRHRHGDARHGSCSRGLRRR